MVRIGKSIDVKCNVYNQWTQFEPVSQIHGLATPRNFPNVARISAPNSMTGQISLTYYHVRVLEVWRSIAD